VSSGVAIERARPSVTEELAAFAANLEFERIPASAVEFVKALSVKTFAAALGGSRAPSAAKLAAHVRGRGLPEEVGALGHGFRTSTWEAVLLNIFSGHSSELEDVAHSPGGVSWDITVIPVVATIAERMHLSGRQLIEAMVAGLEVHYRTCLPFDATPVGMVLPPTAAMGCAAGAARAMETPADQTVEAMGLAFSSAPMAEVSMGTDAHFFESALHGLQGLIAAETAQLGLTGNADLAGFEGMLAPTVAIEDARAGLGERWLFEEMWIKKYPVCFLVHRQLDALLEICAENGLGYEDIESIEVVTGPGEASCDRPRPRSVGDLQFSFQHALGVAALTGGVRLADVRIEATSDPRFAAAREKVSVSIDESLGFSVSLAEPTSVIVRTADGRSFERERLTARGSPEEPLARKELSDLFHTFVGDALAPMERERILEMLWDLDQLTDVAELMRAATFAAETRGGAGGPITQS
jgi:2-methylcitrate dehydratase PrpD